MKKLIGLLTLLTLTTQAFGAATRTIEAQNTEGFFSSQNLAIDAGFEGKNKGSVWVASGGSLSTTTTNPGRGDTSGTWDASANAQTLKSKLVSIPKGLYGKNGVVSCTFKAASGTAAHTLTAYDGSANLVTAQTITSSTSLYARTSVNFIFPSTGSIQVLISATQDEVSISIDDCYLGLAEGFNISNVSQATQYGAVTWVGTASCTWARTSSSSFASFSADSDCTTPTGSSIEGLASAPSTKIPAITLNNLGPGKYHFEATGAFYQNTSGTFCSWRFSDGTNVTNPQNIGGSASAGSGGMIAGDITYSSPGSPTIEIQGTGDGGSGDCQILNSTAVRQLRISVTKYPTVNETSYRPELYNWRVDASISGANPSMGSSAQTAYVGIEDTGLTLTNNTVTGSNVLTAQIPCSSTNAPSGTTCSSGSESVGVSWTQPIEGDVKACASFSHGHNGASNQSLVTFQIVETAINAQTILQEGKDRISSGRSVAQTVDDTYPLKVCGTFHLTAGQKALRLMYEQPAAVTTNVIYGDASSTNGQRDIHWTVEPITQSVPTPIFVGSVTSQSSGALRLETADFSCAASGSAVVKQSSSWISSITNGTTGTCTLNHSGIWSAYPQCVVSSEDGTARLAMINGLPTTTTIPVSHRNTNSNAQADASNISIICVGPR